MVELDPDLLEFSKWRSLVRIAHLCGSGGLIFCADPHNENLWWSYAYCPGALPNKNTIYWLMLLARDGGCKTLATRAAHKYAHRLYKKFI